MNKVSISISIDLNNFSELLRIKDPSIPVSFFFNEWLRLFIEDNIKKKVAKR